MAKCSTGTAGMQHSTFTAALPRHACWRASERKMLKVKVAVTVVRPHRHDGEQPVGCGTLGDQQPQHIKDYASRIQ